MKFTIIIATSQKRTNWLINISLASVYKQIGINKSDWSVLIIDDNEAEPEFTKIQRRVEQLRSNFQLKATEFTTTILRNQRTRFMSGTGAWNTGIFQTYRLFANGFVSILDDDDEYLPNHLSNCVYAISKNTVAVFQRLIWKNEDKSIMNVNLTKERLTPEDFFVGNPGVQGSNMFFKTKNLIDIGGFDETLPNTTDRDLMIRFLWKNNVNQINVLENIGVIHYNHKQSKVNNNIPRKQQGLDLFYKKHKARFSEEAYQKSLTRAKNYFNYIPIQERLKEQIIICMPLKNAEKTVRNAVFSVLNQIGTKREIILLIGNDNSTDNSETILKEITSLNTNVILLHLNFSNTYLSRNFLNDYARKKYPNCVLIGRLDADDVIYNEHTISQIETLFDQNNFDVLLCGNKQMKNGIVLDGENSPSKNLFKEDFLLNQLFEMTQGNPKAELPSCNTFIKPTIKTEYPDKASAEDHWFTVLLLLQKDKLKILIDEQLLYCSYSLDGFATHNNKKINEYIKSRKELYSFLKQEVSLKRIEGNWNNYIKTDGLAFHLLNIQKNKVKLEKYWNTSFPINNRIKKEVERFKKNKIRLLDVGCGPFPKSGVYHQDYIIERTLVDSLGDEYHMMLNENSVNTYGQKIIPCNIEEIETQFNSCSYDIIYSKNALDHSFNPIRAISSLINLLCKNGVIVLEHYVKEGAYTNYFGLHQWDFFIENGDFHISSQTKDIKQNLNILFRKILIESFYVENKIINIIRKSNV
jgi:SAM-dependent methyltransferase